MTYKTTGYSATELIYNIKISEGLKLLNNIISQDRLGQRFKYRQKVIKILDLTIIKVKAYYDANYKTLYFQPSDKVFLRLYYNYRLAGDGNRKFI